MTREQKNALLVEIEKMPTRSKFARERKANALRHYANIDHDNGAVGRIKEIMNGKSTYSHQTNFAKQGKPDSFVKVDGKRHNAEYKTNGGRIGSLLGKNAPKFVIYEMDVCNAGTSHIRRVVEPKVFKTEIFVEILVKCNAIKDTNGKNSEPAIQVTSKKFYEAIEQYAITYEANRNYSTEEF
jgi:hypothetical protein